MSTGALFHDEIAETTGFGVSLLMLSERLLARRYGSHRVVCITARGETIASVIVKRVKRV